MALVDTSDNFKIIEKPRKVVKKKKNVKIIYNDGVIYTIYK